METQLLRTFVAVAREGSITRASERLHLSQPAVSAHIKAIEDALGLALFERTARGMRLTGEGQRLLAKAEQALAAHRALMEEATRLKGQLSGTLRLGAGSNATRAATTRLVATLAERCPGVEVVLEHGTSADVVAGLRSGRLDAAFYNEPGDPDPALSTVEVSRFGIHVAAPPGLVPASGRAGLAALARATWIYPTASACCGRAAEALFASHGFRPERILGVDREDVTRTLIAGGTGVGLLHTETARDAEARGEVELVLECPDTVRVLFAHLAARAGDPLLAAVTSAARDAATS